MSIKSSKDTTPNTNISDYWLQFLQDTVTKPPVDLNQDVLDVLQDTKDMNNGGGKQKRRRKSKAKKSRRKATKQRKNKKRKTRRRSS